MSAARVATWEPARPTVGATMSSSSKLPHWLLNMLAASAAGMVSVYSLSNRISRRTQLVRLLAMARRWQHIADRRAVSELALLV